MIMSIGRFVVDPAQRTAFQSFAEQLAEHERRAPGCLMFGIYEDVNEPDHFIMLDQWVDQELLEEHILTEEFDRNEERLLGFVVGEPSWDDYEFEV